MLRQWINWRTGLAGVAILIITGTIFYSRYLAHKIARDEKMKVEQWVEAMKFLITASNDADLRLGSRIVTENNTIPIIETDEKDSITQYVNLDSARAARNPGYVEKKLRQFRNQNAPILWTDPQDPRKINRYYYGNSRLLNEVRYYPLVQLIIVALFILITLFSLQSSYRSSQNQVWAGMAKETAHQLGTPVSSLEGWVEMLKENPANEKIAHELEKDVNRLRLVSDRFGKIGSTPHLEPVNLVSQINQMVDYMRKRAPGKIRFQVESHGRNELMVRLSAPLFDWVIENLLKNALDAMEGQGNISVDIRDEREQVWVDVTDTGKGISSKNIPRVFKPGFTTKKRGWGLGLSLSKRIIERYHQGQIFVRHSEPGKGTTFRIVLKK